MRKITINALSINPKPSGGKTYIQNLLVSLLALDPVKYQYYLLCTENQISEFRDLVKNNDLKIIGFPNFVGKPIPRILIEQFYLPYWLKNHKIDLLFAPRNVMPLMSKCPTVLGVLSMHLNYEAQDLSWWRKQYGQIILRSSARKASAFVAISEYAGQSYIEKFNEPAEKLFITPLGYDNPESGEANPYLQRSPSQDLLFVSTLFPHKNLAFLLEVFSYVNSRFPATRLVIVGRNPGDESSRLKSIVTQLQLQEKVKFTGSIQSSELLQWYKSAKLFVFPSLREGFGLTVLEAMANGMPTIASNRTSIPEVVGNAGVTLDPKDTTAWVDEICKVLSDEQYAQQLSRDAFTRAKQFSWINTAKKTQNCFDEVLDTRI